MTMTTVQVQEYIIGWVTKYTINLVMLLFSCQTKLKKQTFPKQFSESESPNNWA